MGSSTAPSSGERCLSTIETRTSSRGPWSPSSTKATNHPPILPVSCAFARCPTSQLAP
ncbi:hypothetical protein CSHISOI_06939 [Colletotrichum shisoi]|uniref:Uncharacterized protein n=1 Tax=Colletotrichum shisoi TaxID=2078593 RepID=A0A5Q4BPB7_9PEZI|nr:hypothetical protein CSHISOI_06939 [Colletotrichum shisoi]